MTWQQFIITEMLNLIVKTDSAIQDLTFVFIEFFKNT